MYPLSIVAAIALDVAFGDPRWLPHPVRWMGRLIAFCEQRFYPEHRSVRAEFAAGCVVCSSVIAITATICWLAVNGCGRISPYCLMAGEIIIGFYCLCSRSLATESKRVLSHLENGDLVQARKALAMIVGRDTEHLDGQEIVRATVETVAENITDGIVAPLVYLALGGPVAGIAFKAASTMDSMIGHKNGRYRHFGTCAARLDDLLNFIPARLTGFFLIPCAAAMLGLDARGSISMVKRDRLKHESPNSAHGEAAVAGALRVQLGGTVTYQGIASRREYLGDRLRTIETDDIRRTVNILSTVTAFMGVFSLLALLLLHGSFLPK